MVLGQFSDIWGPQGYGFHPIKNLRNCDYDFVAPFNSKFHDKTLCESGVMCIFRFVTYLSPNCVLDNIGSIEVGWSEISGIYILNNFIHCFEQPSIQYGTVNISFIFDRIIT